MSKTVAVPSQEYNWMALNWAITTALRGGTPAMRAAGRHYLPQEPSESEEAFKNRLNRSVLTNIYKKTVDKIVGKPLRKPIQIGEDVPEQIKTYLDDVDNLGSNLDVFASQVLTHAIDDGLVHVLVDFPPTASIQGEFPGGSLTLEQQAEMNIRPFARIIKAEDLIGWKWEIRDGRKVLVQIRIREHIKEDDPSDADGFTQVVKERIRVIEPGLYRVYEQGNGDDYTLIDAGPTSMPIIPLVTFYTNRVGFMQAAPALLDLAYLNVAHWQSDSDQRNILHVARVPILFGTGFGDAEEQVHLEVGPNSMTRAPQGADLKFVEHSGAGIEAGAKDLESLEERMEMLGLEMLVKRVPGNPTATAKAIDQAEADSPMGIMARELEKFLEQVLDLFARWLQMGDDAGGNLTVFKDFSINVDDFEAIKVLLDMRSSREISQTTFWREVKRRGFLSDEFEEGSEIDLLDLESPLPAEPGSDETRPTVEPPPERSNQPGDTTGESEGHKHTLQENGRTDTVVDPETGESHDHAWEELGIKTSVDAGHSHVLRQRSVAGTGVGNQPVIDPNPEEDDGGDEDE